jgi:hypothetical protein
MTFRRTFFSFLYWHNHQTGEHELSSPRVAIFSAAALLVVLACLLAVLL